MISRIASLAFVIFLVVRQRALAPTRNLSLMIAGFRVRAFVAPWNDSRDLAS
jgi:hypothetical protein